MRRDLKDFVLSQLHFHLFKLEKIIKRTQIYLVKVPLNVEIVKQNLLHRKQFLKFYEVRSERGDFNSSR